MGRFLTPTPSPTKLEQLKRYPRYAGLASLASSSGSTHSLATNPGGPPMAGNGAYYSAFLNPSNAWFTAVNISGAGEFFFANLTHNSSAYGNTGGSLRVTLDGAVFTLSTAQACHLGLGRSIPARQYQSQSYNAALTGDIVGLGTLYDYSIYSLSAAAPAAPSMSVHLLGPHQMRRYGLAGITFAQSLKIEVSANNGVHEGQSFVHVGYLLDN